MPGRTPQPVRLVDDEQVDARVHGLPGQLRSGDQRLQSDDRAAMRVKRVEPGAKVAGDVCETLRVEQREHLMIFAPQLAKPLHGQRLGHNHQTALDRLRVQQPVHDQRGFNRLPQPDFVGEQPSHGHPRGRPFGNVELMREQPDTAAEERSEAARLSRREQVQDIEPGQEVFGIVDLANHQPIEQRLVAPRRLLRCGHERVAGRREPERGCRIGKLDDQDSPFNRGDTSRPKFRIKAVSQAGPTDQVGTSSI